MKRGGFCGSARAKAFICLLSPSYDSHAVGLEALIGSDFEMEPQARGMCHWPH